MLVMVRVVMVTVVPAVVPLLVVPLLVVRRRRRRASTRTGLRLWLLLQLAARTGRRRLWLAVLTARGRRAPVTIALGWLTRFRTVVAVVVAGRVVRIAL